MALLVLCVVSAVTVRRVLLFVCDVSMMRECEDDGNAGIGDWRGVVAVSAMDEYMGDTRGSCIVFSADDMLDMSVVHGVRGVVCEMCMCLARVRWEVRG